MQDTEPSWLTMVDRGASTVWEAWHGIDEHGVADESLNHYSKGAVISFLHRYVAGIRPRPRATSPTADSGSSRSRAAGSPPLKRSTTRRTVASSRHGASTRTFEPPDVRADHDRATGNDGRRAPSRRHPVDVGPGVTLHHCTLG